MMQDDQDGREECYIMGTNLPNKSILSILCILVHIPEATATFEPAGCTFIRIPG